MDYFAKFIDRGPRFNWSLAGYLLAVFRSEISSTADDTAVINASLVVRGPGASGQRVAIAPHLSPLIPTSWIIDCETMSP